jgi:hypothetical protein
MKMFSDCSDACSKCQIHIIGGCLAGHGDDDFTPIDEEFIKNNYYDPKYIGYKFGVMTEFVKKNNIDLNKLNPVYQKGEFDIEISCDFDHNKLVEELGKEIK